MRFEWDDAKNLDNVAKHNIGFETAKVVFDDPHAISYQDCSTDDDVRWQTFGTISGLVVVVAHTCWEEDGEEVIRIISARERLHAKGKPMKLTKSQAREIRVLKRMKDEEIDLTDIPELVNPTKLFVGRFYRPIKQSLTIRMDADILAWVKGQGRGYQTRINSYLRQVMYRANKYPSRGVICLDGGAWPRTIQSDSGSNTTRTLW